MVIPSGTVSGDVTGPQSAVNVNVFVATSNVPVHAVVMSAAAARPALATTTNPTTDKAPPTRRRPRTVRPARVSDADMATPAVQARTRLLARELHASSRTVRTAAI